MRVIKIGGSLLDWDALPTALDSWLVRQPNMNNVWVVGGGQLVDGLKQLCTRYQLAERDSHWLAVNLLDTTAQAIAQAFPNWQLRSAADLKDLEWAANTIVAPSQWLRTQTQLPETWSVTSDSIAATLSVELHAAELVLLKSASPPVFGSLMQLSELGYCDPYLPIAASKSGRIRLVNLRDEAFTETIWQR